MIKQRRMELGLSQRALAKRVGVTDAYITRWKRESPTTPLSMC